MEDSHYKKYVVAAVHILRQLTKNEKNDFWVKSKEEGRDVLVQHKYQQAFPWWSKNNSSSSWTTEASRASAFVKMDHLDLADTLAVNEWSYWFPNMVAKDKTITVISPRSSEDNPHGTLRMVYKEMQATSPMVANRKFTLLRSCSQIDQATWVIAEISFGPNDRPTNTTYRRLPSGCLIEGITKDLSKVTWVEHVEVFHESLPNQTLFYDHLIRSGFAFGAERMVAWLERSGERVSHMNVVNDMIKETPGQEVPWILEKLSLMEFGESMVRGLFQNVGPNEHSNSTLWRSLTGSEDLKVYASLYKSSANFEVAGGVVDFSVRHSPEFVLETLGDERTHHEWDVLGGLTKLNTFRKYLTGGDSRNNISAFMISSNEMLIKEVNVNRSGSQVLWSTVSMKTFDLISKGQGFAEDSMLISGFSITAATNTGGSVITLVLRMLVQQPLQEQRQQSIDSITLAINQTVERLKESLEKHQQPSPGGDWPTEKQQVEADDIASDQIMLDELGMLKMN